MSCQVRGLGSTFGTHSSCSFYLVVGVAIYVDNIQEENKLLFVTGCSFATWNKAPLNLDSYLPAEIGRLECSLP